MKTIALLFVILATYGALIYLFVYAFLIKPRQEVKKRHGLKALPKGKPFITGNGEMRFYAKKQGA